MKTFFAALCIALATQPALAESQEARDTAQLLVVRSGLAVQLQGLVGQMKSGMEQQRGKVSDELVLKLVEAAGEAFRPEVLQDTIARDLARRLQVGEMKAALAWLGTDLGRRITLAEEAASHADDEAIAGYMQRLKETKPTAARVSLINEVIEATYAEDLAVRSMQAMALGVALGMDSTLPRERRLGMARIEKEVNAALPKEKVKQELRATMAATSLYAYRELPDDDLRRYVEFLRSPGGKRYSDETTQALMDALVRASVRLGQLVDQKTVKQPA
jgi:Uncharacterized protein conserved in bacteria (DUF2059)